MPKPPKQSAHAQLDQLRRDTADERVTVRDLEAQLEAAKHEVESASRAISDGYAAESQRDVAQARKAEEAAIAQVEDLQHRLTGAEIRVERAQQQADTFARQHAEALLDERAADARQLALELTRAGHDIIRLHRAYLAMRMDIDALVGATPNAVPRADGPPPSHPWERQLKDLERAVRETPEIPAPLPTWAGLKGREQRDQTNRLLQLGRRKRLTEAEQAEMDRLSQDGTATPNVAGRVPS